ncbi:hypothetical protein BH23ACT4_BH23ACT4_11910 [soil metagenome]
MVDDSLVVLVEKLVGNAGKEREFDGQRPVKLRLGESRVDGPMQVSGRAVGTSGGVDTRFEASSTVDLVCNRCLTTWSEPLTITGSHYFGVEPDEDGYAIVDGYIDVGGVAKDELALALPARPLCSEECLGLCPTCGIDLNREPCGGHGDDSDSPFAALKDLFDS